MKDIESHIYNIALDNIPGNIYWKDKKGVYLGCNANMAKIFKLASPKEIVGKTDYDFFLKSDLVENIIKNDQVVISSKSEQVFEEIGTNENKELVYYLTKKVPIKDQDNHVIGLIGISIDITAQKKAEAVKGEFVDNMSHDLRTPFCGIIGAADLLFEKENDLLKKEYLTYITDSAQMLLKMINQIIKVAKLKDFAFQTEKFDLKLLLEEVTTMLRPSLKLKKLRLTLDCSDFHITTDRFKLSRILLALLTNAIQFTPEGSIRVVVSRAQRELLIRVRDTGIGISEAQMEHIFTWFYKAKPSYGSSSYTGLGTGLYIAKTLALELQGNITVSSTFGKGSTFTVGLPYLE